jgi:hypothetical protein
MLHLPAPELLGLAAGEIVVAFAARGTVNEGDEVELAPGPSLDPAMVKPAYRRWLQMPLPDATFTAVVIAVDPAQLLDPEAGGARHLRTTPPTEGDLLVLRVSGPDGAVLSDEAFAARHRSVEGAIR